MRTHLLLISILFLIFSLNTFADVRYVSTTGTSTYPYLSWDTAADSIQKCLNVCNDGDTVYVANGVYKDSLKINKKIWLVGSSMDSTTIDGTDLSAETIYLTSEAYISNFNIIGKGANLATRAIWAEGYIEIENCKIHETGLGIAILFTSSKVNNVIMYNLY